MSGLEPLISLIYHEKQQHDSQLCAQHALNTAFQGDYFQAPDLAQLAQQLDTLEGSVNADAGPVSNNMDDTGFFSVEVLERGVSALGFTLVRWRSELLRSQQQVPHHQMAFILNHQEHWFTLRRFGNLHDPESGHWFNLNSFLDEPEWVSKLYLGMVLAQAEDEGYSVFAVIPLGDDPETLPHTEADDVGATLPQPSSSNTGIRISKSRTHSSSGVSTLSKPSEGLSGFEDEDMELQAALQASLVANGAFDYAALSQVNPSQYNQVSSSIPLQQPDNADDSIEANMARSLARNREMMNRMQQEQEMALRENEIEERFVDHGARIRQNTGELEEDEALRQALEASRNIATTLTEAEDTNEGEWIPPQPNATESVQPIHTSDDRVYDDEDADLQAALRASLEGLPEGYVDAMTDSRPNNLPTATQPGNERESSPVALAENENPEPARQMDPEEIRRKRLARFGGGQ